MELQAAGCRGPALLEVGWGLGCGGGAALHLSRARWEGLPGVLVLSPGPMGGAAILVPLLLPARWPEIPMTVGGGLVPVVLPVVSTAARKPQGERQGRGEPGRRGAGLP